jgi:hypothetical protein
MMKIALYLLLSVIGASVLDAQSTLPPGFKGQIYSKERSLEVRAYTNGYFAAGVNWGKLKTFYKTTFITIELGQLRHPKEFRSSLDNIAFTRQGLGKSYIYAKQNNLYTLRLGWGAKRYFSEKDVHRGVAVGFSYTIGPTLGLIKPYYIDVSLADPGSSPNSTPIKYSDENAYLFLDQFRIRGASGFTKGLSEIRPIPGGHARIGAHFDWGAYDEFVRALEVGIMLDVFPKVIPIMVERPITENRPYFLNFYIAAQLGKRT